MDNVVLITGASTGFGRVTAELLGRRGYRVFATMRDTAGRNATARGELEALGLEVLELDVTDDSSVQKAVSEALGRAGRIDVVINNAGFGNLGVTEAYTVDQFRQSSRRTCLALFASIARYCRRCVSVGAGC